MLDSQDLLSAADFMNYEYCPRIIYFTHVLKQPQTKGPKQKKGLEKDFSFKKTNRTKIIKQYKRSNLFKIYNIMLKSKHGLITKIDCIAIDVKKNYAFPIQLKYSYKPKLVYRTQKVQLILEALLIEEVLHYKVPYGYIKYIKSNQITKVLVNKKDQIFKIMSRIKDIIKNEKFPEPTPYIKRCVDCCYKRICRG